MPPSGDDYLARMAAIGRVTQLSGKLQTALKKITPNCPREFGLDDLLQYHKPKFKSFDSITKARQLRNRLAHEENSIRLSEIVDGQATFEKAVEEVNSWSGGTAVKNAPVAPPQLFPKPAQPNVSIPPPGYREAVTPIRSPVEQPHLPPSPPLTQTESHSAGRWFIFSFILFAASVVAYFAHDGGTVSAPPSIAAPAQSTPPVTSVPYPEVSVPSPPIMASPPISLEFEIYRVSSNNVIITVPRTEDWFDTGIPEIAMQSLNLYVDSYRYPNAANFKFIAKLSNEDKVYPDTTGSSKVQILKLSDNAASAGDFFAHGDFWGTLQLKVLGANVPGGHLLVFLEDETNWAQLYPEPNFWNLRQANAARLRTWIDSLPVKLEK